MVLRRSTPFSTMPISTETSTVTFGHPISCLGSAQAPTSVSSSAPTPQQLPPDLAGIFSVVFNRNQARNLASHLQQHNSTGACSNNNTLSLMMNPHGHPTSYSRYWPSFSMSSSNRSFWTKYCLLCTICGSASTILAGIFLIIAVLFRYYTTSIYYFETVPTYIPAILLSICGVSTIAFSCKRNRNIILLRITACWSLVSAALSSVITITTSLIHMNRLQTLKECVYTKNPPSCTCFGHSYGLESVGGYNTNDVTGLGPVSSAGNMGGAGSAGNEPLHFVFENTIDCDVIHGVLYSCLRAVFAISVVAVLLSIFLCMLLYQLIGHERKKAYWSRIRRINSDWSTDFLACLPRNLPRERSGLMPLVLTPSTSLGLGSTSSILHRLPSSWGPPPPYEPNATAATTSQDDLLQAPMRRTTFNSAPHYPPSSASNSYQSASTSHTFIAIPPQTTTSSTTPTNSISPNLNALLNNSHPFSPTITSIPPSCDTATTSKIPKSSSSYQISSFNQDPEERERLHHHGQLKLEARRNNFIPQIMLQQQMTLRESKISISSDSDNLYSMEEDLFKDPNREKELETKINNQIISLLLLEEADAAESEEKVRQLLLLEADDKTESKNSSLLTLQQDTLDEDYIHRDYTNYDDQLPQCSNNLKTSLDKSKNSRIISSLPSSPFLNNVKKYFRTRTNSLRLVASPKLAGKIQRNINYIEFGAGADVDEVLKSHSNPNYSYNDENEMKPKCMILPSKSIVGGSDIAIPKNSALKILKSRSLPGSPLKKV